MAGEGVAAGGDSSRGVSGASATGMGSLAVPALASAT
jgi:hypothetical protein